MEWTHNDSFVIGALYASIIVAFVIGLSYNNSLLIRFTGGAGLMLGALFSLDGLNWLRKVQGKSEIVLSNKG